MCFCTHSSDPSKTVHEKGRQAGFEKPCTQQPISLLVSRHNLFKPSNPYSKFKSIISSPSLCWLLRHLSRHLFVVWASLSAAGTLWLHHVHTDIQQTHPFSQNCAVRKAKQRRSSGASAPLNSGQSPVKFICYRVGSTGTELYKP